MFYLIGILVFIASACVVNTEDRNRAKQFCALECKRNRSHNITFYP